MVRLRGKSCPFWKLKVKVKLSLNAFLKAFQKERGSSGKV
jgi:hypothetical protein